MCLSVCPTLSGVTPTPLRRVARVAIVGILALAMTAMIGAVALSGGDLRYAWRVLVHGDAGTDDVAWKDAVAIPAPSSPVTLDAGSAGCAALERLVTPDADATDIGDPLEDYLTTGGATALLVIRDGETLCAWDAADVPTAIRPVFSVSKTVLALALARAVEQGAVTVDDSLTDWIPELLDRDPRFAAITLGDLVDMRSGIAFDADAGFPWLDQDAARVYYATDLRTTTLEAPRIEARPGGFVYNDYAPNLLGLALERATGEPVPTGLVADVWGEVGAPDAAAWLVDDKGFAWHESGLVATAADLAAIGDLLLSPTADVAGSAGFAQRSLSVPADIVAVYDGVELGYGNGWWVLDPTSESPAFAAMGRFGQIVLVDPTTRTVIVRLGNNGYEHIESNAAIAARLLGWVRALD